MSNIPDDVMKTARAILPIMYSSPFQRVSNDEMLREWRRHHPKDLFRLAIPPVITGIKGLPI